MEGMDCEAMPGLGAVQRAIAQTSDEAAIRPDCRIRFEHDLDPFRGGSAKRRRTFVLTARGIRAPKAPPRIPVVLNKGLRTDRPLLDAPRRRQGRSLKALAKPVPPWGAILSGRTRGPNAAHPDTEPSAPPLLTAANRQWQASRWKTTQSRHLRAAVKLRLTLIFLWSKQGLGGADS
jgi:hypothetical protein